MRFCEIPGQEDVKRRLMQTVADRRISHAQLFYGPEGSGKLALAIAYAQYINCTNRSLPDAENNFSGESCGECPSCSKYQKLIHPDLHFYYPIVAKREEKKFNSRDFAAQWRSCLLDNDYLIGLNTWYEYLNIENKQGIINAEDCNEMIRTISVKPYESEYKILIIWMVEKLYYSAAPKILKVLEEPPPKTLFLLVCENHDEVLNTIISRTQFVKVHRFDDLAIMHYLKDKYQSGEETLKRVISLANGNILEAVNLVQKDEDEQRYYENFRQLLQLCYKNDVRSIVDLTEAIAQSGREQIKEFLNYGLRVLRYNMLYNAGNRALIRLDGKEYDFVANLSKVITTAAVPSFTEEIGRTVFHIERNGAPRLVLLDMALCFTDFFAKFR